MRPRIGVPGAPRRLCLGSGITVLEHPVSRLHGIRWTPIDSPRRARVRASVRAANARPRAREGVGETPRLGRSAGPRQERPSDDARFEAALSVAKAPLQAHRRSDRRCPILASSNARARAPRASAKRRWRMPRAADNARAVTRPAGCRHRALRPLPGAPYRSPSAAWRRATKQSMCEDLAGSSVGNHSVCQLLELEQGGPR